MPLIRQRLGTEDNDTDREINQLLLANWQVAKREFILSQKAMLRKSLRRNLIHADEVEGLIETKTEQLPVAHVPI